MIGDSSTYTSYTENGTTVSLPYNRPCKSTCEATTYLGSSCAGLLEFLEVAPDCSALDPTTTIYAFDESNSTCNSVADPSVRQPFEEYTGSSCDGVVAGDFFIPPEYRVSPLLAPLTPPSVIQSALDAHLGGIFASIPNYITKSCHHAIRKLICGSAFMPAVGLSDLSPYISTVYFPQYPHHDICVEMMTECAEFLVAAPALAQNCSGRDVENPSVRLYPEDDQTLFVFDDGTNQIPLITSPASHEDASTASYEPVCPNEFAFVIPEDPSADKVDWIPGTACAMACPYRAVDANDMDNLEHTMFISSFVGLFFFIVAIITFSLFPWKIKSQMLLIYYAIGVFMAQIVIYTGYAMAGWSINDVTCSTNASYSNQSHTPAAVFTFGTILLTRYHYFIWLFQSIHLYRVVVLQQKGIDHHSHYYAAVAAITSICFAVYAYANSLFFIIIILLYF